MRVAQIMLGKGFGGAERSFVDTALALAKRGHEVLAICHRDFSKIELLRGIENLSVETLNAHGEWDFMAPRRIARLLTVFKAEVVHTQLKRAAWHGGRAAARAGVPVVSKLHNYVDLARYRYVHTLFCTTEDQQRHVLEAGWSADRVEVVPNFSSVEALESPKGSIEAPYHFLSYGRYVRKKGFGLLLRAFRKLLDAGVDARLTIGGSGPELDELKQLSSELGLEGHVGLGVWIEDVAKALDAADFFVLPSLDEPFGIVMLEAMARGVPIVSTMTKGPSEVLSDSTARLVETGSVDALFEGMLSASANVEESTLRADNALSLYRSTYAEAALLPKLEALYLQVIESA